MKRILTTDNVAWMDLIKDPFIMASGALVVLVSIPLVVPALSTEFWIKKYPYYFDTPLLALAAFALWRAEKRTENIRSGLFWNYLAFGFGFWLTIRLGGTFLDDDSRAAFLATDLLYLAFYLFLILAFQLQPHQQWQEKQDDLMRQLESAGATLFSFGLLIYIVVIPATYNPISLFTHIPSAMLYVVLNLYLLARVLVLRNASKRDPWRGCYNWLLVATAGFVLLDGFDLASRIDGRIDEALRGTLLESLWLLPIVAFIAAARLFTLNGLNSGVTSQERDFEELVRRWRGKLTYLAVVPPLIHILLEIVGWADEQTRAPREILVVIWVLTAAALSLVYDRRLLGYQQALHQQHEQINQQLEVAQRMDAVQRMAGGIAHDFNNLLMVIQGFSAVLVSKLKDSDALNNAENILKASQRAGDLTRQLLAIGAREKRELQPFLPNEILRGLQPTLERLNGADLSLALELEETGYLLGDRSGFEDAVLNLFLNARDASMAGGTIYLKSGKRHDNAESPLDTPGGGYGYITVEDRGRGMDAETRTHIFEPFYRKREGGTGLGLSMVDAFARESGGSVEVESQPGQGSRFTIILPESHLPGEVEKGKSSQAAAATLARTILLVEDEELLRDMLTGALEDAGMHVIEACDGSDALRVLNESDCTIDLVVTDVVMPKMDGGNLARQLWEIDPDLPIIFMTGYAAGQLERLGSWAKTAPILRKPFTPEELVREIEERLVGTESGVG